MALINDVVTISVADSAADHPRHGSGGGGFKSRTKGTRDLVITLTCLEPQAGPAMKSGDKGTLKITKTATNGVVVEGPFQCVSKPQDMDLDDGAPAGIVYEVGCDGALTQDYTGGSGTTRYSSQNATIDWTAA